MKKVTALVVTFIMIISLIGATWAAPTDNMQAEGFYCGYRRSRNRDFRSSVCSLYNQ